MTCTPMTSSRIDMTLTPSSSVIWIAPVGQMLEQVPQPIQSPSLGTTKVMPSRFSLLSAPPPTISLQTRIHRRHLRQPSGAGPRSTPYSTARSLMNFDWGAMASRFLKADFLALVTSSLRVFTSRPFRAFKIQESKTLGFPARPRTSTPHRLQAPIGLRAS